MIADSLQFCARHGQAGLILGLAAGILGGFLFPGPIAALSVTIAPIVIALLFVAVLRLGPDGVRAGLRGVRGALAAVVVLQVALPVAAALGFAALGWQGAVALGVVLTLSGAPITGAPNLAILAKGDPVAALRALVLGTALLPLTVIPVFLLVPTFGDPRAVAGMVLRLLAIIAAAGGLALLLRALNVVRETHRPALDGVSAILLAAIVVPLMGAVGPTLLTGQGWALLALVLALNFGLQLAAGLAARARGADPAAAGIVAGNRNVALFLGILPAALVTDLLPYIGLYQIPMYLTPLVMPALYRWLSASPIAARQ